MMHNTKAEVSGHALVRLSVNEWCVAYNASRATAYRKMKRNELETIRLGKRMLRIVVRASDLIDLDPHNSCPSICKIREAIGRKAAANKAASAGKKALKRPQASSPKRQAAVTAVRL